MAIALNLLLHGVLLGSLALFLFVMVQMVAREPIHTERVYRVLALVAGAVVALGAQASGVSFATFTVHSLAGARPASAGVSLVAALVPGGVGALVGWYFVRVNKRSSVKALRFVTFIGMLTAVGFAEIYAVATSTKGVILGVAAIPNASFVAGIVLSVLITADVPGEAREGSNRLGFLSQLLRGRASGEKLSSSLRGIALNDEKTPRRTNPWARD